MPDSHNKALTSQSHSILLVGLGNMGGAILAGWLDAGLDSSLITVLDPAPPPKMMDLIEKHRLRHCLSAEELNQPDIIMLAVKPQILDKAIAPIQNLCRPDTLIISVAAGKTTQYIGKHSGSSTIVRTMPNTPALIGRGITALFATPQVTTPMRSTAETLMQAVGQVVWLDDEALMDPVTAISGSGPAYVFLFAELLTNAGVKAGLPQAVASQLALQTIAGAGELLVQSDDNPATLRENVTSPQGTTHAALSVFMNEDRLANLIEEAVFAAAKRSEELS